MQPSTSTFLDADLQEKVWDSIFPLVILQYQVSVGVLAGSRITDCSGASCPHQLYPALTLRASVHSVSAEASPRRAALSLQECCNTEHVVGQ